MTVELVQLRGEREREKWKKIIKNLPYQKIIYIYRGERD